MWKIITLELNIFLLFVWVCFHPYFIGMPEVLCWCSASHRGCHFARNCGCAARLQNRKLRCLFGWQRAADVAEPLYICSKIGETFNKMLSGKTESVKSPKRHWTPPETSFYWISHIIYMSIFTGCSCATFQLLALAAGTFLLWLGSIFTFAGVWFSTKLNEQKS